MNLPEVLIQLQKRGTAKNREVYQRHGVREPVHGVAYADLDALEQAIGVDHALALELWKTGIHDARVLAARIADPAQVTAVLLEDWVAQVGDRFLFFAMSPLVARSPLAPATMLRWIESPAEWVQASGWQVVAALALDVSVPDQMLVPLLPVIERRLQKAPNFARYAMNSALIAIGGRPAAQAAALVVAARIGKVDVDHGDSSCKTPDAVEYIGRMAARAASRSKSAKPAKAPPKAAAKAKKAPAKAAVRGKKTAGKKRGAGR
ncbi:MAG: DNA alkylation repair protein [Planctomycetes bacterium]|nr:DNA alkylation repair protein [Planctomycetota bacterium]